MKKQILHSLLLMALVLPMLLACGRRADDTIVIASKDFAEQYILGHMYALLLEDAGHTVELKLGLAGTPVAHAAITSGEIDLYPEYTGTGLLAVLKLPVESDRQVVYDIVTREYAAQFNLVWLDPAPMNNAQALAVPQRVVEQYGIRTISDMAANASELRMVGPAEFPEREDGLPGLRRVYGDFELAAYLPVEKGLRYVAIESGEADVTVAFGTDGELAAYNMLVLEDDKGMFPPYQVAPLIRESVLAAHPDIADILNRLAPLLDDSTMQRLNYEVSGNQREPIDVAREFLVANGLLD